MLDTSRSSCSTWLCWSSASLMQCGPNRPNWIWTQIWVQARMPDYRLNWTARSSVIQSLKRWQWCSLPTRRWPSWSRGSYSLKSAIEHWPSSTDARQSAEKPLREAQLLIFLSASHNTGLDTRSMTRRSIILGIREGKFGHELRLDPCLTLLVIGPLSAMWAWWV